VGTRTIHPKDSFRAEEEENAAYANEIEESLTVENRNMGKRTSLLVPPVAQEEGDFKASDCLMIFSRCSASGLAIQRNTTHFTAV